VAKFPYELQVALRYTRARRRNDRRNRFVSFMSMASMAGIALGVAALIVVLSVMNGFQKEVRDRMLGVVSHIEVLAPPELTGSKAPPVDWDSVLKTAKEDPRVVAGAPYVLSQAMLTSGDSVQGAIIRGIVPSAESGVDDIGKKMAAGSLDSLAPGDFNVAIGIDLARALRVRMGDKIVLIAPQGNITPAGMVPRLKQFTVTGVFESGHFEYDSGLALIAYQDAQRLFRSEGSMQGLRLKTVDALEAYKVAADLMGRLPPNLIARDWGQINRNWFSAVQVEKRMMFIILTLIIAVAAFNLVSSLVMTVTEKQSDIAILRTLGASPRSIMGIFMLQGGLVGIIGSIIGVVGGTLLAENVDAVYSVLGLQLIPKGVYFIDYLPTDTRPHDVAMIGVTALVLSILATLYPSWSASRVNPAEALRYE